MEAGEKLLERQGFSMGNRETPKKLVSIVITTHARSDKIERALLSAINQTYDNIEVIVVDDNSDNLEERKKTEEIVKQFDNVKYIKNKRNLGGAVSRNVGINAAKGELISFLDDDDQYLPNRIEQLSQIIEMHKNDNIGLAYCSCSAIDECGNPAGEYVHVANWKPFYEQMIGCVAGTSMWLTPKTVLKDIGGFDDVPSKQDSTVILKMLVAGYNIFGTAEKLVIYFGHPGNGISGTKMSNAKGIVEYRKKCRRQYHRIKKSQIPDIECNFSRQLVTIYLINNEVDEAKKELKNIWKNKPASKIYLKNLVKVYCRKKYIKSLTCTNTENDNV